MKMGQRAHRRKNAARDSDTFTFREFVINRSIHPLHRIHQATQAT
jgi:hypothetical protein